MAMAERSATTVWEGDLPTAGRLNGASGALSDLGVTWAPGPSARTGRRARRS